MRFSRVANFKQFIPFITTWEGGLTGNPADSASSNPAPCGYDPKYDAPYHTNKGVTWTTFKDSASTVGYEATCANFLQMPKPIWEGIYKKKYWDRVGGDLIQNQAIANAYVSWAWGSGVGGARSLMQKMLKKEYGASTNEVNTNSKIVSVLNMLAKQNSQRLYNTMIAYRRQFFLDISQPGTANAQFRRGWLNRLDDFAAQNARFVKPTKTTLLVILLMAVGAAVYLKTKKQ